MKPITKETLEKDRRRAALEVEALRELAKLSQSSLKQKSHNITKAFKQVSNVSHFKNS